MKTIRKSTAAESRRFSRITSAESLQVDERALVHIRGMAAGGEGQHLEFKAKANHPDKIARSLCSFANSSGGTLLLGVSDSGVLQGVRYPDEDVSAILAVLHQAWPKFRIRVSMIAISGQRWLVRFDVREGRKKPVTLLQDKGQVWFRQGDECLQAGPVRSEMLRRETSPRGAVITFGKEEKELMGCLANGSLLSLRVLMERTGIPKSELIGKLAALVAVGVLRISSHAGDERFSAVSPG